MAISWRSAEKTVLSRMWALSVLVTCFVPSCQRKSTSTAKSPEAHGELNISCYQLWQLPVDQPAQHYNIGGASPEEGSSGEHAHLDQVSDRFAKANAIHSEHCYGVFRIATSGKIVSMSMLPTRELTDAVPHGLLGTNPGPHWMTNGRDWGVTISKAPGYEIKLSDLSPLKTLDGLEYMDFGFAGFKSGVWEGLADLSNHGSLRGFAVFRGHDMLKSRGNIILPRIKGLALRVESADDLKEFGDACPNLSMLVMYVTSRQMMESSIGKGILATSFPRLRALYIANGLGLPLAGKKWPDYTESDHIRVGRIFHETMFPGSLEWICVQGDLLSLQEMLTYDGFAKRTQFSTDRASGNLIAKRNIEVVFSQFGLAGGFARPLKRGEILSLDRYWREKQ